MKGIPAFGQSNEYSRTTWPTTSLSFAGANWSGKTQGNFFSFKVREKPGNSLKWSGKLENLQKSGNFKVRLCSNKKSMTFAAFG